MPEDLISREKVREVAQHIFSDPVLIMAVNNVLRCTPAVDTEPRWVPVTERLPENDDLILCYGGGFCMCSFFKNRFNDFDENGYSYEVGGITHWMPLPQRPKEVKE